MSFWTNGIQLHQYQQKKCVDHKMDYVKNKPHLVTFNESIMVNLWTFQLTLVCVCVCVCV